MEQSASLLPLVWFAILSFILLVYTMLDGFDLGVGIISLFIRDEESRGILMGSLGSIWDANETWLVLFGGIIFGAFPAVYGMVMSALYVPLVLMLLGLIFRAVSFEFRSHARSPRPWSAAFGWGSLVAAACQGFAFGGLLWGIRISGDRFAGGVFDWLMPFSVVTAITVMGGYVMVGSTYLVMKTEGRPAAFARRTVMVGAAVAAVGAATDTVLAVVRYPFLMSRWGQFPGVLVTLVPFALAVAAFVTAPVAVARGRQRLPFAAALASALFAYLALAANYFPIIVPPSLTVYEAAAQPLTLRAMLWAVGIALPALLAYNALQYWVFRGKVTKGGYHAD